MNSTIPHAMDNRFFLLPYSFDVAKLRRDLAICEAEQWTAHFNTNDYSGDWNGIALRSASGTTADILTTSPDVFSDTPLLEQCTYFREILAGFDCPVETVRLLALSPGSSIKEHRDPGLGYEHGAFRLHIPITTDPAVSFVVDQSRLEMEAGQCWYANFSLPHSVQHDGNTRRIHLVIDGLRNAWTDHLFETAGYDFEAERKGREYDRETKMGMIKQLRLMNTDTARAIIASLEAEGGLDTPTTSDTNKQAEFLPEEGWIPVSVESTPQGLSFKWVLIGDKPYTEPFFHDTLSIARHSYGNKAHPNTVTTLEQLLDFAERFDHVAPTAFFFHISRCGSTLMSQALASVEENIVLSEVPLLDEILRLPFQEKSIASDKLDRALIAVLHILARKKGPNEKSLFIKTDCWHVFFYEKLRRLFPQTPFIFLYRRPDEVIRSHQKQRGLQSNPSTLEAGVTGIPYDPSTIADLDAYLIKLLEQIFRAFIKIKSHDPNIYLVNYNQGTSAMLSVVEKATGIRFDDETRRRMESRSLFHAKKAYELFAAEPAVQINTRGIQGLMDLYTQLDQLRK
jgi:hypothetical protein